MNQGNVIYGQNVNLGAELVKNQEPREQVELFISYVDCNTQKNAMYSARVGLLTKKAQQENIIGQTNEKQGGEKTIDFEKSFVFDYYFESKQTLNIYVCQNNTPIAAVNTTVGKLMGSKGQQTTLELNQGGLSGKVQLSGVPVKTSDYNLKLDIAVNFGNFQIQPYFMVKRNIAQQGFNWIQAYKSEVLTNYPSTNKFEQVSLSTQFLCNSDLDNRPILIEFFDLKTKQILGGYCAPISKILQTKNSGLVDPTGKVLQGREITITSRYSKQYKFLDYIRGGSQVSLVVGIDFTGSNGDPKNPNSLHSIQKSPNLYEQAIDSCCTTVAYYDADQQFPTFGYGAIVDQRSNKVDHCFPLNLQNDPNIYTVHGILETYRKFIQGVKLYGPTMFCPLIKKCNQIVSQSMGSGQPDVYTVLMIYTDGIINDMNDTKDEIVQSAKLPISIIVIGIGPGGENGFEEMEELDSDEKKLTSSRGEASCRDIVQFVEFGKFGNNPTLLAEKVLEEIPRQVVNYYKMMNKPPGDPIIDIKV